MSLMVRNLSKRFSSNVILVFFFSLILLQAIASIHYKSATFDEVMRQLPGYLYLTAGDYQFDPEQPPLIKMLAALPLLFTDVKLPPTPGVWTHETRWQFAQDFLYAVNDGDKLVLQGRLAVLPLTLLLGFFIFRWAKEIFGHAAAIFALTLFSFEPNILAHGRLMNTDLAIACFSFMTIYGFYKLVHHTSLARLLFTGFALGLALLTKFSALLCIPILLLLGLSVALTRHPITVANPKGPGIKITDRSRKFVLIAKLLFIICLAGSLMIWGAYRFRYAAAGSGDPSFQGVLDRTEPEEPLIKQGFLWAKELKALPESYLFGLSIVVEHSERLAYLMGEVSHGWRYYFLVTFLLKTPLPLILLLALAGGRIPRLWREQRIAFLFLVIPVVVYFGIASASRFNIGHRHLLPIYPFLFVFAGSLIPWLLTKRAMIKGLIAGLIFWYLLSSVSIFPHYLAYFNELVGGPKNGYRYLVDSNLDWGQDLKGLKKFMDESEISQIYLSYFGTADPCYYGINLVKLPGFGVPASCEQKASLDLPDFIAISATNVLSVKFRNGSYFEWLKDYKPIAQIGYSIFVYNIEGDASAHNNLGNVYLRTRKLRKAVNEFRQAGELAPKVAVYHANRGYAYYRMSSLDKAEQAYKKALSLDPEDRLAQIGLEVVHATK